MLARMLVRMLVCMLVCMLVLFFVRTLVARLAVLVRKHRAEDRCGEPTRSHSANLWRDRSRGELQRAVRARESGD